MRWIRRLLICVLGILPPAVACADSATHDPQPLPPRTQAHSTRAAERGTADRRSRTGSTGWTSTAIALVVVLGLVIVTAKIARRGTSQAQVTLPVEVFQILGRKMLDYRSTIHLVRCGSRLLVVGISQSGMTTLAEINDPVEVDYLAGLCKSSQPVSVGESFGQLFRRFQGDVDRREEIEPDGSPAVVPMGDPGAAAPAAPEQALRDRLRKEAAG